MTLPTQTDMANRVIRTFEGRLDVILDRLAEQAVREIPELQHGGSELLGSVRLAAAAELRAGIVGYGLGRRLPTAPPTETGELARHAARDQLPLAALLRVYAIALNIYWEAIYDAMTTLDAPVPAVQELVREGTIFLHDFVDQMSTLATQEYTAERDRTLRRRTLRRQAAIRDVLSGTRSAGRVLDYELDGMHIGLVATGAEAEDVLNTMRAEPELRVLAIAEDEVLWVWITGQPATLPPAIADATRTTAVGLRIGVGRPAEGADGFRATHRQARSAHRLAIILRRTVARHEDIALEDLAGRDTAIANHFVRDELAGLLDDSARGQRLSETLRVYLALGQNGTSTAARLGISQRTVSHRLREVERILGRPIAGRAVELGTALRLQTLINLTRQDEARRHQTPQP